LNALAEAFEGASPVSFLCVWRRASIGSFFALLLSALDPFLGALATGGLLLVAASGMVDSLLLMIRLNKPA